MEKETLGRDLNGGGKEELGEEEWVSLNQLPKTQEMRRDGSFRVPWNKGKGGFI